MPIRRTSILLGIPAPLLLAPLENLWPASILRGMVSVDAAANRKIDESDENDNQAAYQVEKKRRRDAG